MTDFELSFTSRVENRGFWSTALLEGSILGAHFNTSLVVEGRGEGRVHLRISAVKAFPNLSSLGGDMFVLAGSSDAFESTISSGLELVFKGSGLDPLVATLLMEYIAQELVAWKDKATELFNRYGKSPLSPEDELKRAEAFHRLGKDTTKAIRKHAEAVGLRWAEDRPMLEVKFTISRDNRR